MTVHSLTVRAPAKINLFLHILGQKPNGYHELQTLFHFLDLCDEVSIQTQTESSLHFTSNTPDIPLEQQLVVKAAQLLQQYSGTSLGARIHLHKRIPMEAGLGGGSSDAASTLLALNQLWSCHLSSAELHQLALSLGADVPIFVYGHSAFAGGIGEQLSAASVPDSWYVLAQPNSRIATHSVFQHPHLPRHSTAIDMKTYRYEHTRNDCEALVRQLSPAIDEVCRWLSAYGLPRLTGTGSCVFMPLASTELWPSLQQQAPEGCRLWLCRGLNDSPVWLDLKNNDLRSAPYE